MYKLDLKDSVDKRLAEAAFELNSLGYDTRVESTFSNKHDFAIISVERDILKELNTMCSIINEKPEKGILDMYDAINMEINPHIIQLYREYDSFCFSDEALGFYAGETEYEYDFVIVSPSEINLNILKDDVDISFYASEQNPFWSFSGEDRENFFDDHGNFDFSEYLSNYGTIKIEDLDFAKIPERLEENHQKLINFAESRGLEKLSKDKDDPQLSDMF